MADKPTTITADNGSKFELVIPEFKTKNGLAYTEGQFVLKPVVAPEEKVEKHTHYLKLWEGADEHFQYAPNLIDLSLSLSQKEAQTLSEAIKATVRYVQDAATEFDDPWKELVATVSKAREAYRKEQEL